MQTAGLARLRHVLSTNRPYCACVPLGVLQEISGVLHFRAPGA